MKAMMFHEQMVGKFVLLSFPDTLYGEKVVVSTKELAARIPRELGASSLKVAHVQGQRNFCEFFWSPQLVFHKVCDELVVLEKSYPNMTLSFNDTSVFSLREANSKVA